MEDRNPQKRQPYEKPKMTRVNLKPGQAVLSSCDPGQKMARPWHPCLYTCNKETR